MTAFRSSASFGKRQEYIAVGELLKRNFDVYMTLVDDQQIDCIIRIDGLVPVYRDIQIKARSRGAKNLGTFAAMEIRKPRPDFFFVFYSEAANTYWIIPSEQLVKRATRNKSGKAQGRYRIVLTNTTTKGEVRPRPKWAEFQNKFELLSGT